MRKKDKSISIHTLKTWPEFFEKIVSGDKTFEIRRNDRGFQVGHFLRLREFDPKLSEYSGRVAVCHVTYITDWGQPPGQIVMSINYLGSDEELIP